MSDYTDLLDRLKRMAIPAYGDEEDTFLEAIRAIESLLKQRDEAQEWSRLRAADIMTLGQQVGALEAQLAEARAEVDIWKQGRDQAVRCSTTLMRLEAHLADLRKQRDEAREWSRLLLAEVRALASSGDGT